MSEISTQITDGSDPLVRGSRLGLGAVLIGTFVGTLSNNFLNVPLHSILVEFNAPLTSGIFVIVGFMLTFAVSMPIFGWLGERYGLRLVYVSALVGSGICAIGAALAPNLPVLVVWRALAGVAAASFAPVVMALIAWMFGTRYRPAAVSAWATVNGIGQAVGPSAGGLIDGWLTWRWAMAALAPLCVFGVIATLRFVPRHPGAPQRLDYMGAVTFTLGTGAVVLSILLLSEPSVPMWLLPGMAVLGVALVFTSGRMSRRTENSFVPVHQMREREYVVYSVAGFAQMFAIGSILVLIPLYLTSVQSMSTAWAGIVLLALPVTMALAAPYVPRVITRLGLVPTVIGGLMVLTISLAGLATVLQMTESEVWLIAGLLVLNGLGIALVQTPASTGATQTRAGKTGAGLGIFNLIRFSGSAMGAGSIAVLSRVGDIGATSLLGAFTLLVTSLIVVALVYRPWIRI